MRALKGHCQLRDRAFVGKSELTNKFLEPIKPCGFEYKHIEKVYYLQISPPAVFSNGSEIPIYMLLGELI